MKIDGRVIAQEILEVLKKKISKLSKKPHLAIILVGNDAASVSYVNQKVKKAEEIGATSTVYRLPSTISEKELSSCLNDLNHLSTIDGIIVQRPLPDHIDSKKIDELTSPGKDIDGFNSKSKFPMPLALAVMKILEEVFKGSDPGQGRTLTQWLQSKNIVVIGKGETGGGPIIEMFKEKGIEPLIIDSKTKDPHDVSKNADIIISTIGKPNVIKTSWFKKGVILIGVGMYKGPDGKLHGDYNEHEVENIASFYTTVPGGVGPLNVAMLLSNLVKSAEF